MKISFKYPDLSKEAILALGELGGVIDENPRYRYGGKERYELELPDNFHFFVVTEQNGPETEHYIYLNGIQIMRAGAGSRSIMHEVDVKAIETAKSKQDEFTEDSSKDFIKYNFHERFREGLYNLAKNVFGDGAERGYASYIPGQLTLLKKFKEENSSEHDAVIASNPYYLQLKEMFPNWTDTNGWESKLKTLDAGGYAAFRHAMSSSDTSPARKIDGLIQSMRDKWSWSGFVTATSGITAASLIPLEENIDSSKQQESTVTSADFRDAVAHLRDEPKALADSFRRKHNELLSSQPFASLRKTAVQEEWGLGQILQHAQSEQNRSRDVCVQLGWMKEDGSLNESSAAYATLNESLAALDTRLAKK